MKILNTVKHMKGLVRRTVRRINCYRRSGLSEKSAFARVASYGGTAFASARRTRLANRSRERTERLARLADRSRERSERLAKVGGEGGIRTHVPLLATRRFRGAPVTTTSVPLRSGEMTRSPGTSDYSSPTAGAGLVVVDHKPEPRATHPRALGTAVPLAWNAGAFRTTCFELPCP